MQPQRLPSMCHHRLHLRHQQRKAPNLLVLTIATCPCFSRFSHRFLNPLKPSTSPILHLPLFPTAPHSYHCSFACASEVQTPVLEHLLEHDSKLLAKLARLSLHKALARDPWVRFCPQPDCPYAVVCRKNTARRCPILECGVCTVPFCIKCRQSVVGPGKHVCGVTEHSGTRNCPSVCREPHDMSSSILCPAHMLDLPHVCMLCTDPPSCAEMLLQCLSPIYKEGTDTCNTITCTVCQ